MPITDFEKVFPQDGDIPSELDVFNQGNKERQLREKVESVKKELKHIAEKKAVKEANESNAAANIKNIEIED